VHSASTSASSVAAGAATTVLGFTISAPQKLKARARRNALVSDARCKGNARRWALEGRKREAANVMPMLQPLKHRGVLADPFRVQQPKFGTANEAKSEVEVDRPQIFALDVEEGCLARAQHPVDDAAH